ncbi:hypothetical protein Mal64_29790 [Pseudobythopirellula maris]|uniref:DUF3311 domain-containing protein n=2 Tax=Pseudobythopirellula maris TaxID=2527991 RepID=A0A5C5ZJR3_9BACT|nr:hypothetical protein Mal64_29790 [Pseudobythopirellula maris]
MRMVVWGLVLLLLVLHQDIWFWNDGTLVFGFMPIALFFHACISIAASVTWFMATKFCWPTGVDDALAPTPPAGEKGGAA